jgi:hypothetical protein
MRRVRLAVLTVLIAWIAACSSDTAPPEQSTTSPAPTGHGAFAQCLSEHGVPAAPGPAVGPPPGVDQAVWDQAMQACSSLAPGPAS